MSLKHLNNAGISTILNIALEGRRLWASVPGYQSIAEEFSLFYNTILRVVEERNQTRVSAQRLHKKVKALQKQLNQAGRDLNIERLQHAGTRKILTNHQEDHNRKVKHMMASIELAARSAMFK